MNKMQEVSMARKLYLAGFNIEPLAKLEEGKLFRGKN